MKKPSKLLVLASLLSGLLLSGCSFLVNLSSSSSENETSSSSSSEESSSSSEASYSESSSSSSSSESSSSSSSDSSSDSSSSDSSSSSSQEPSNKKDFKFIVNESLAPQYGDSLFIKYGDWECLVDGGEFCSSDKAMVSQTLNTYCTDHKLDLFIGTHAHSDHLGYFRGETADSNPIKNGGITSMGYVIDSGSAKDLVFMNSYLSIRDEYFVGTLGATYIPVKSLFASYTDYSSFFGENIMNISGESDASLTWSSTASGDVSLYVLNTNSYLTPGAKTDSEPNNTSVSCLLSIFNERFIFCGDADKGAQNGIMANYSGADSKPSLWSDSNDVYYKANHHAAGASNSNAGCNSQDWISWMKPDTVLISTALSSKATDPAGGSALVSNITSAGIQGIQHPYPEALKVFRTCTDEIYWNGVNGTMVLSMDSTASSCTFAGTAKKVPYYDNGVVVTGEENTRFVDSKYFKCAVFQAAYNA